NDSPAIPRITIKFAAGIPRLLLRAWLDVLPEDLTNALRYAKRLNLLEESSGDLFRALTPQQLGITDLTRGRRVFDRVDGKQVILEWQPLENQGFMVFAQAGEFRPPSAFNGTGFAPTLCPNATDTLIRISGAGIRHLAGGSASPRPIRTLYESLGK